MSTKDKLKNIIKVIFLSLLIVYLFFAVLDFSLRIVKYFIVDDLKKLIDIRNVKTLCRYDRYLGHTLNPNYKGEDGTVINSQGFRDGEIKKEKLGTRIVVLGDSIAFGYGQNCETWPDRLEVLLNKDKGEFEVINTGVPNYASIQTLILLKQRLLVLSPDIVVVSIGWNDLVFATYDNWYPQMPVKDGPRIKFIRRLNNFMFVKLFNAIAERIKAYFVKEPKVKALLNENAVRAFEKNLEEIVNISKEKGIKVILITLPTSLHKNMNAAELEKARQKHFKDVNDMMKAVTTLNDIIRQVALKNGAVLFETDFSSLDNLDKDKYFVDYCHFNKEGSKKFSEEFYDKVFKK